MSDLTQRLRAWAHDERLGHGPLLLDAAAEIERLRDIISPGDAAAYEEGMAALLARCEAAEARLALARHALTEIRLRLHAVGRRPEECYEMSLIDDVLAQEPTR